MLKLSVVLAAVLLGVRPSTSAQEAAPVVSWGEEVDLTAHLAPARPTVFIVFRPASSLEGAFVERLRRAVGDRVGWAVVHLRQDDAPIARQYRIERTPAALVYDRRGRLAGRASDPDAVQALVADAARVMRIDWPREGDPRFDQIRRMMGPGADQPGILRTMSYRPEALMMIARLSEQMHFSDGFLDRRAKEMIATYVSALNRCRY